MQKPDFNRLMEKEIEKIVSESAAATGTAGQKPTLLLHACCAPCSSSVLERLLPFFSVTVFYYNPNIYPETEYRRRLDELKTFLHSAVFCRTDEVALVEASYNPAEYYAAVRTEEEPELQTEPERGERCRRCYAFRMNQAFRYAMAHHFDYMTTTLSVSPHKDAAKINEIGILLSALATIDTATAAAFGKDAAASQKTVQFLYADFKKKNGFLRSLALSAEYGLYRQDYCGCEFSARRN